MRTYSALVYSEIRSEASSKVTRCL